VSVYSRLRCLTKRCGLSENAASARDVKLCFASFFLAQTPSKTSSKSHVVTASLKVASNTMTLHLPPAAFASAASAIIGSNLTSQPFYRCVRVQRAIPRVRLVGGRPTSALTMADTREPKPALAFVEIGTGCDLHGQSATKAAVRACRGLFIEHIYFASADYIHRMLLGSVSEPS
jgi:Conserved hypothetical protein (Lin0512_fam)